VIQITQVNDLYRSLKALKIGQLLESNSSSLYEIGIMCFLQEL